MRVVPLAVIALVVAVPVFGDPAPKQQLSVFVTPEAVTYSKSRGTEFNGGIGAALNVWWTPRFSTEVAVAAEQSYAHYATNRPTAGGPITVIGRERVETYPLDALVQYHFVNDTKWQPYLGAGARYVREPTPPPGAERFGNQTSAEINGGVLFQFAPRWALKLDIKQLLRGDTAFFDSRAKGSIGVAWRF